MQKTTVDSRIQWQNIPVIKHVRTFIKLFQELLPGIR